MLNTIQTSGRATPRRVFTLGRAVAIGAALLICGLAVPERALADRAATPSEVEAMIATIRAGADMPGYRLAVSRARVSTVNAQWGLADVGGASPEGGRLEPARYVFVRPPGAGTQWRIVTVGSSLGGCRDLRRQGIPVRVIDDLSVSQDINYRCANPPATGVACLVTSSRNWSSTLRQLPRFCDLSLSGDNSPALSQVVRLRALRWSRLTATSAVAVGVALPNRAPFTPYRVRVRFSGWVDGWCGPQFSRALVISRWGRRAGPLPYGTCPIRR